MFGFKGLEGAGSEHAEKILQALEESKQKDKSILFTYKGKTSIFEKAVEKVVQEKLNTKASENMEQSMTREQFKGKYEEILNKTAEILAIAEEVQTEESAKLAKNTEGMTPFDRRSYITENKNPLADGEMAMTAVLPVAMIKMMMLSAEYLGISAEELKMLNMNTKKD